MFLSLGTVVSLFVILRHCVYSVSHGPCCLLVMHQLPIMLDHYYPSLYAQPVFCIVHYEG